MLAQAAISIANTQRRVYARVLGSIQKRGNSKLPIHLTKSKRDASYEVTVVDQFYQLGQQSFAHHGSIAMWERPMKTGKPGRPEAVDISLFNKRNPGDSEESRLEFGVYTKAKLERDAKKLHKLSSNALPDYKKISNYLILWEDRRTPLTAGSVEKWLKKCQDHAGSVSTTAMTVTTRVVSSVDLFCEDLRSPRVCDVAIFSVN